jgi:hypothetical protein
MYLSVNGEHGECIGLFAVQRVVSKYAERIYAYMEKAQRNSWRIRGIRQET